MENKNEIKETIFSFFKNKIPRNAQLHFQHWLLQKENAKEKDRTMYQLWDEIDISADESTYKDLKEIHTRISYLNRQAKPFYISWLRVAAILLLPVLLFTVTYIVIKNRTDNLEIVQYYVPKGETKYLRLSDGSEVWINSDSYFSFPKKFVHSNRTVNLTGEAYFHVAKKSQAPFIVSTDKMNVEVLGTKFNVNAYSDLMEIKATLAEGKVKVNINNNIKTDSYTLLPNEEFALNVKTGDIAKRTVDTADTPAWNDSSMIFNSTLLSDIFKQVERKYGIKIACNNPKYDNKRLTVKFQNNENISEVLKILQLIVPDLKVNKQDSIIYIK